MARKLLNGGKIVAVLCWCYGAGILLWYGARLYPGEVFAPVRFVGYVAPWLLIGLVSGLAVGLSTGRRTGKNRLALFMALLLLLVALPYGRLFLPRLAPVPEYSGVLRVMSFSTMGRNRDYQAIAAVIREAGPDIFFVQEAGMPALEELLADMYGGKPVYRVAGHGGFIASRFPLQQVESESRLAKAVAETPFGRVTLWTIHAAKAIRSNRDQLRQMEKLVREIESTPGMKIVGGDFNTTDKNEPYKMLDIQLDNAHREAGWGFGFTFPTRARRLGMFMPFLRIDHIWYSNDLYALNCTTLAESGGSDHLPVVAELAVIGSGQRKR